MAPFEVGPDPKFVGRVKCSSMRPHCSKMPVSVRCRPPGNRRGAIIGVNKRLMTKFRVLAAVFSVGLLLTLSNVCRSQDSTAADQPRATQLSPGDSVTIQILGQPEA